MKSTLGRSEKIQQLKKQNTRLCVGAGIFPLIGFIGLATPWDLPDFIFIIPLFCGLAYLANKSQLRKLWMEGMQAEAAKQSEAEARLDEPLEANHLGHLNNVLKERWRRIEAARGEAAPDSPNQP